ncbi:MAG TPA: rhomboid family intramembrane serine protease [Chitinophagaceae bacterium]
MFSITVTIIIITCLISIAAFGNQKIQEDLLFWPAAMKSPNQYYRFFTYGLIHADYLHLGFNMISFWSFGQFVEQQLFLYLFEDKGKLIYISLYVLAIIVSTLPDFFRNRNNYAYRALGASGAVSAVIFAGITLQPMLPIRFFFIPIDIPGYLFALIFLGLSTYLAKRGQDNIGHGAHITGAVFGLVYTIVVAKVVADFDAIQAFIRAFGQ